MLSAAPRLRIHRPSPTTVEFTVSTAATSKLAHQLLHPLTTLLRLLLGLNILFLLYTKYQTSPFATPLQAPLQTAEIFTSDFFWVQIYRLTSSRLGLCYATLATRLPVTVLLPCAFVALYLLSLRFQTSESLLVLRGLGVQISSSSPMFCGQPTTRFIPTEKIQDILINEAFYGFEVRYYLVVVVEMEEELMVVFPKLLPRLEILEQVWKGSRACLWGDTAKVGIRDGPSRKKKDVSM
ncbi:hypothetical protein K3495_g9237 [Podosphaera aphanis]|nr:hypothetical protein K3495_g9237 [Podosphaera aphanis]